MTTALAIPEAKVDRLSYLEQIAKHVGPLVDNWKESRLPIVAAHQIALVNAWEMFLKATQEPVYLVEWTDHTFGTDPMTLEEVRNQADLFGAGVKRLSLWDKHEGTKQTYQGLELARMMNPGAES